MSPGPMWTLEEFKSVLPDIEWLPIAEEMWDAIGSDSKHPLEVGENTWPDATTENTLSYVLWYLEQPGLVFLNKFSLFHDGRRRSEEVVGYVGWIREYSIHYFGAINQFRPKITYDFMVITRNIIDLIIMEKIDRTPEAIRDFLSKDQSEIEDIWSEMIRQRSRINYPPPP